MRAFPLPGDTPVVPHVVVLMLQGRGAALLCIYCTSYYEITAIDVYGSTGLDSQVVGSKSMTDTSDRLLIYD